MTIYYTVYEVECQANGKKYRGAHQTTNPDDAYLGSGPFIKKAIAKYGRQNFTKAILFMALTEEFMYEVEAELIDAEWVKSRRTYNVKPGGIGGAGNRPDDVKLKISNSTVGKKKPVGFGERVSAAKQARPVASRPVGSVNTDEHNAKISAAKKGKPAKKNTCPHCGKTGGAGAMSRHHFGNCKTLLQ